MRARSALGKRATCLHSGRLGPPSGPVLGPWGPGALGPGQVLRPPRKVGSWECRWKLAPELTLHRPRTAAPCCTGAPHVCTWGRRTLLYRGAARPQMGSPHPDSQGTTDGASPCLILVVLHLGTPSAPTRWEASHAALHQLLSLPFSWLWHVCVWSGPRDVTFLEAGVTPPRTGSCIYCLYQDNVWLK